MRLLIILIFIILLTPGCKTIDRIALKSTQGIIQAQYESFLTEEDPVLAKEAFASNLKLVEGLLIKDPTNLTLRKMASESFFGYGFGYVELEDEERASKLYLRGMNHALGRNEAKQLFFETKLDDFNSKVQRVFSKKKENLFWATINFASWANLNKNELNALNNFPKIKMIGELFIQRDEDYHYGGGDLLTALFYCSKPKALGGTPEKSVSHFDQALKISKRKYLIIQLFYARYFTVAVQDTDLFDSLINEIRDFDLDSFPDQNLTNRLALTRAEYLSENKEEFFIDF